MARPHPQSPVCSQVLCSDISQAAQSRAPADSLLGGPAGRPTPEPAPGESLSEGRRPALRAEHGLYSQRDLSLSLHPESACLLTGFSNQNASFHTLQLLLSFKIISNLSSLFFHLKLPLGFITFISALHTLTVYMAIS